MEGGPDRKIKLDRAPGVEEVTEAIHVFCWSHPCPKSKFITLD